MSTFRHPKTQSERKGDQALLYNDEDSEQAVDARIRTGKSGTGLPTERDDKTPAANADRARGKKKYSRVRKSKEKARQKLMS
jgi:hypothetical protein